MDVQMDEWGADVGGVGEGGNADKKDKIWMDGQKGGQFRQRG